MKNLLNIGLDLAIIKEADVALLIGEGRHNYVYLSRWYEGGIWYAEDATSGTGLDRSVEYHENRLFVENAIYTGGSWRIEVRYQPEEVGE